MRSRHWDLTKKIVGQDFTLPMDDSAMTVGVMLGLQLHLYAGELEELSDQSMKEAKMEKQLGTVLLFFFFFLLLLSSFFFLLSSASSSSKNLFTFGYVFVLFC